MAVFREVRDPNIGQKANQAADAALDQEHPLPPAKTILSVKVIKSVVDDRAGRKDDDLPRLHERKPELLFAPSVPS